MEQREEGTGRLPQEDLPTVGYGAGMIALGDQIGRYKLLSILGEGGFGIVYLAEQRRPVRRHVALKVIKPGMDSLQVMARFEAERQALALLDHPNIAHVLDGGTTAKGHPYFVMEHIKGTPITSYCDREKLTIEDRLRLFVQVCEAVQHAHQKGIIHRDLKPSNILVTTLANRAVPKVIDFGVAKALSQPLTARPLVTGQDQRLGTPEYMSPEQTQLGNQDIDTRSDVYALGVLLYELLTGTLPFDREISRDAPTQEFLRIIREEEPPRPSTRLSRLGEESRTVATRRCTDSRTLTRRLSQELEWIPLMAMRKERNHRYRSAGDLAEDIGNYLAGRALLAGPESVAYRARKLIHRHRPLIAGAAAVLLTLTVGIIATTIFALRAERSRVGEVQARVEAEEQRREAETERDKARAAHVQAEQHRREAEHQARELAATVEFLRSASKLDLSSHLTKSIDLKRLSESRSLQSLSVTDPCLTDEDLIHLRNLTSLKSLLLPQTQVTDAGLIHVRNLTELRQLNLPGTRVGDAGLAHLTNLRSLEYLELSDTQVTDAGLGHLRHMSGLYWLGLKGTRVGDAGLEHLRDLHSLRYLELENTAVTNAGLVSLRHLGKLEWLSLQGTRATQGGVNRLQRLLPNCHMVFADTGNLDAPELLARWGFDESGPHVLDSSAYGLTGTYVGAACGAMDPGRGSVLNLDGRGSYVDCTQSPVFNISSAITVAAWIKVRAFDKPWQAIVTKGDSAWRLQRDMESNHIEFACTNVEAKNYGYGQLTGTTEVNDGRWHHVAGVYDGNTMCLYVDGAVDASSQASGRIHVNEFPVLIGANAQMGEGFFNPEERRAGREWNGWIDDVRIYNYGLSAEEIGALYRGEEPPARMTGTITDSIRAVHIPDASLKQAVSEALGLPGDGSLRQDRMLRLVQLQVRDKGIVDLTGLEHARNLQDLWAAGNQIVDLSPLARLTELRRVELMNNRIRDLSPLAGLKKLELLYLWANHIEDLSPLRDLTTLTWLSLGNNRIRSVEPLAGLVNLRDHLNLSYNQIDDLAPLAGLTKLTELHFVHNRISDIRVLRGFVALKELLLAENRISDISPLSRLAELTKVEAHENQIRDISALAGLTRLSHVDLRGNPLDSAAHAITIPRIHANNPNIELWHDAPQ